METIEISGRVCNVISKGKDGAKIYMGIQSGEGEQAASIASMIDELAPDIPYVMTAFESEDWNGDFSPWKAPPVFGNEGFSGGGAYTLEWLENECIPVIESSFANADSPRTIVGYSLSGLFSLWAMYESKLFSRCASCSGSLWFPDWIEYAGKRKLPEGSCVYLSLGDREELTKNAVMSSVGECTRKQGEFLSADFGVREYLFELNKGGHFNEPDLRMAKGAAWVLKSISKADLKR